MKPTNNAKDGDKGDGNAFDPEAESPVSFFQMKEIVVAMWRLFLAMMQRNVFLTTT